MTPRHRLSAAALAAAAALLAALPAAAAPCIENGTDAPVYAAAESDGAARGRVTGWIEPGARLCAGGAGGGTVWAFADPDAVEGCGRRTGPEGARLEAFAEFDRCRWSVPARP